MYDAIVVGAGPAGNGAALVLASRGLSVTVIDWRTKLGDKLCTGIVGRECLRQFPINSDLVRRQAKSAQIVAPNGQSVRFEAPLPLASVVDRAGYVASLARQAQDASARYLLGQRVLQVQPDGQGVTVQTSQDQYRARAVVLAAGFGTPLSRQVGFSAAADYVYGVQAEVASPDLEDVEVHLGQQVAPGFFAWLVPTLPGRALAGLMARRNASERMSCFLHRLGQQGKITAVETAPARWGIPLRPIKRTYRDRILLAGDAAGQVKPTTGGGIFYSLMAGELAAGVLADALADDDLSADRLGRYQSRWHALLAAELDAGYAARRIYEFLSDQQINFLVRQAGSQSLRAQITGWAGQSFDWHSQVINRLVGHPALGGALQWMNPLLCRLALRQGGGEAEEVSASHRLAEGVGDSGD
ncbi:MAG: geranylgeranyl reductase family protein [SAR202 cluster bacterium]|nr:geranylgeranyl reductase family protein [SAR202 cluster bacterium]